MYLEYIAEKEKAIRLRWEYFVFRLPFYRVALKYKILLAIIAATIVASIFPPRVIQSSISKELVTVLIMVGLQIPLLTFILYLLVIKPLIMLPFRYIEKDCNKIPQEMWGKCSLDIGGDEIVEKTPLTERKIPKGLITNIWETVNGVFLCQGETPVLVIPKHALSEDNIEVLRQFAAKERNTGRP